MGLCSVINYQFSIINLVCAALDTLHKSTQYQIYRHELATAI